MVAVIGKVIDVVIVVSVVVIVGVVIVIVVVCRVLSLLTLTSFHFVLAEIRSSQLSFPLFYPRVSRSP